MISIRAVALTAAVASTFGAATSWASGDPAPVDHAEVIEGQAIFLAESLADATFLGEDRKGSEARHPVVRVGSAGRAVAYRARRSGTGGRLVRSRAARKNAPEALYYKTGFPAWEPTLGIDDKDRIFFKGRTELGLEPHVYRSDDGGASWRDVGPGAHLHTMDPHLYVDPATDRIFTTDVKPSMTCHKLSFSDDAGRTWTTTVAGCGVTADHQAVFAGPPTISDPKGYPNVVYECAFAAGALNGPSNATMCVKSLDGGLVWVPTGEPAFVRDPTDPTFNPTSPTRCNPGTGHGVADRWGRIYLPNGWCGQPHLAMSDDEGKTWERTMVSEKPISAVFPNHISSSVAVDRSGNAYYSWIADDQLPYLALSRDRGDTWSQPRMIAPPGVVETSDVTIEVGAAGKIALFFMGTTAHSDEGKTWNGYMVMTDKALSKHLRFYGGPINDPADPLAYGNYCCTAMGDFFDVAIGPDGTPSAAMVDGCPAASDTCYSRWGGDAVLGRLVGGPPLR